MDLFDVEMHKHNINCPRMLLFVLHEIETLFVFWKALYSWWRFTIGPI